MKFKKVIAILTSMVSMLSFGMINASANDTEIQKPNTMTIRMETEDGNTYTTTVDLNDCFSVTYDENGNVMPTPYGTITENVIASGSTTLYWTGTEGYSWDRYDKITVDITFDKKAKYEFGYVGAGYRTAVKSGTASSFKTTFEAPADGYYKIYITNKSSEDITVSGTVKF